MADLVNEARRKQEATLSDSAYQEKAKCLWELCGEIKATKLKIAEWEGMNHSGKPSEAKIKDEKLDELRNRLAELEGRLNEEGTSAATETPEKGEKTKHPPIRPGKPSAEIINAFKLEPAEAWRDKLSHVDKAANAYMTAIAERGGRGKGQHTWYPAHFAICLLRENEKYDGQLKVALTNHFHDSLLEYIDLKIEMRS